MLTLQYEMLDEMLGKRYAHNAKAHDIGALMQSIVKYGFRVPVGWDNTLNAIIDGNGRTEALWYLYQQWAKGELDQVPAGIEIAPNQMWQIPVIHGVDAVDVKAAIAFLIDANNLTMQGGDFTALDMARAWDTEKYMALLQQAVTHTVTVDPSDYTLMLQLLQGTNGVTDDTTPEPDYAPQDDDYHWLRIPFVDKGDYEQARQLLSQTPIAEQGVYVLGLLDDNS